MSKIPKGTWVEIKKTLLNVGERAPQVPEDTKATPYVLRVNGWLEAESELGQEISITTLAGRKLCGTLICVNPGYAHGFGNTIPELISIGKEGECP